MTEHTQEGSCQCKLQLLVHIADNLRTDCELPLGAKIPTLNYDTSFFTFDKALLPNTGTFDFPWVC